MCSSHKGDRRVENESLHWSFPRLASLLLVAVTGCAATYATIPEGPGVPVVHRPMTLWTFLGVDQLIDHHYESHDRLMARIGQHFPDLEPKPPLVLNTSPQAAASPSVAVHNAAFVLSAEQQAPQKIKAIKAVAKVGAAAYPQVEEALLAGMDDRNPDVRLASVEAVLKTSGDGCDPCDLTGNCTPAIRHQLWLMGYGVHDDGCPLEPSPAVRRVARLALGACGGPMPVECPPPQSNEFPSQEIIEEVLGPYDLAEPTPADGPSAGPVLPGQ